MAPSGSEGKGWRHWPRRARGNASALGGGLGWTPFEVYSDLSKMEKICVSVLLNSREKNWLAWGWRFMTAWMAAGFWREDRDCVGRVVDEVVVSEPGT